MRTRQQGRWRPHLALRRTALIVALTASSLVATGCGPEADRELIPSDLTSSHCDSYVHPGEELSAAVERIPAGSSLCLEPGTYEQAELRIDRPLTLESVPGSPEPARIVGRLYVAAGANGTVVSGLVLDGDGPGSYSTSVAIAADDVSFTFNDVSNQNTAICFAIGNRAFGRADRTHIVGNTIHNCGQLPRTNFEHGIYDAYARNTVIRHNLIADNADRGVQLYPDVRGARVVDNLITGNGQGINVGGDRRSTSSGNLIAHNLIADSRAGANVGSSFPGPVGTENVVRANCITAQTGFPTPVGLRFEGNVTLDGSPDPGGMLPRVCRRAQGAGVGLPDN